MRHQLFLQTGQMRLSALPSLELELESQSCFFHAVFPSEVQGLCAASGACLETLPKVCVVA